VALASEAGAKSRAKASGERLSRLDIEYYSRIGERLIRLSLPLELKGVKSHPVHGESRVRGRG
jgi:hypothetical protein